MTKGIEIKDADKTCPNDRISIYPRFESKWHVLITTNLNEERRNVNYLNRKGLIKLKKYIDKALMEI